MSGITLSIAQGRLEEYLTAESKVLGNQSYEIAGRRLTRADLSEIRRGIEYWDGYCKKLETQATTTSSAGRATYLTHGF